MTAGVGGWWAPCLISKSSESLGQPCLQMALLPELASCTHTFVLLHPFSEATFLRTSAGSHSKENPRAHLTRRLRVLVAQCGPRHPDSFPSPLCHPLLSPSSRGLERSRARVATAL